MSTTTPKPAGTSGRGVETKSLVTSGYAPVNGLKMYYEIWGAGMPAVYIHPVLSHVGCVGTLAENRKWIGADLQGHGRTGDIDRPLSLEQHADDIAALLKHLKIDRADFFGDSFGGTVAILMAVRHPEFVRRVAAHTATINAFKGDRTLLADSEVVRWQRENYETVAPDPKQWPTLCAKVCMIEWKGLSADELKSINVPVLLASGDHDFIPPERCAEWARLIPNAQLAIIPDTSHFTLFSEPEKLLPLVTAFFDEPTSKLPLASTKTGYYPGKTR